MKKILLIALCLPVIALAQTYPSPTFNSITLQNPLTAANGGTGATSSTGSGSAVLSSGPTIANLTLTGSLAASGLVGPSSLSAQAANTVLANTSASSASPAAASIPGCSGSSNALGYTAGTGFTCNSSIQASTSLPAVPTLGSSTFYPTVPTNAVLQAISTATTSTVTRLGFYASGDSPAVTYIASGSACSLSSGNGDNGSQVKSADNKCWIASFASNQYDIRDWGAKVDGSTDDSTAVQAVINYTQTGSGGTVLFPVGVTALSGVSITSGGITLQGYGWEEYSGYQGQYTPGRIGTHGSYIRQLSTSTSAITVQNGANHSAIRGLAFFQTQPADTSGWSPTNYAPTINLIGSGTQPGGATLLEDLFSWNTYEFIRVGAVGAPASRITLKHIWGMPLAYGIHIYFSSDTNLIEDVHFWQFNQNVPNIISWIQANGIGVSLARSDNFLMDNVFVYGYGVGVQLTSTTDGASQNFQINNLGLDSVNTGLQIIPSNGACNGTINNLYIAGNSGVSTNNINIGGTIPIFITMTNVRLLFSQGNAVAIGSNTDISFVNLYVTNWNQANTSSTVFAISTGSTATLSGRFVFVNGNGAGANSGAGTYNASHIN